MLSTWYSNTTNELEKLLSCEEERAAATSAVYFVLDIPEIHACESQYPHVNVSDHITHLKCDVMM